MRVPFIARLAAPAVIVGALVAGPAGAQPAPMVAGLPAFEIVTILRSTGFEPIGRPVRAPGVFFVRAIDPYDEEVRLTVDARSGRILAVRPMALAPLAPPAPYFAPVPGLRRFYRPPLHGDVAGFEDATGALPLPPRVIPAPRSAPKLAQAAPLPRPRPTQAASAPPTPAATAPPPAAAVPVEPAPSASEFPPMMSFE